VRHRSPLALFALLAALALIAIPAMVAPVGAAGPSMSRHDRIVSFWTPARLRSAIPRDFVRSNHCHKILLRFSLLRPKGLFGG